MTEDETVDWNELWHKETERSSEAHNHMPYDVQLWDRAAQKYSESRSYDRYGERNMDRLKKHIDSETTVLDIGAGPGTFTIPLAAIAKKVTAVEPSTEMLKYLMANVAEAGLTNIEYINERWEDVKGDKYDVVVSSHSVYSMTKIRNCLLKMDESAKKYVQIIVVADMGSNIFYKDLWLNVMGREYMPGPDYCHIYNILHDLGIFANLEIVTSEHLQRFSDPNDAVAYWKERLGISSVDDENKLRSYLSNQLEEEDCAYWLKNELKSAMMWYEKDDGDGY